ncbi:MAG: AhpC/TSA family [Chthonomonadaceae bacterium]|nr:AhpC/TSA family [Chthonomonadaceae bacterium]
MRKRSMQVAGLLALLALLLPACHGLGRGAGTYKIGSKVADFAFKSDQGKTVKLSDYRGKTVVLTMFATW